MIARRQYTLFGLIFLAVLVVLFAIYFAFIRAPYVPLFENLRENDASVIAKELDKQGIAFDLGNGGHDILVPEPDVAKARLAIAGSEMPLGGTVGFELFNESDMGLTEFAQKVNYQRALQGELARTIMGMRGVKFARVHLALPEKTIFRAAQTHPTAAVTVQTSTSASLSADQVAGIQQLVASSVPDMPLDNVAILDDRGDLLNNVAAASSIGGAPADEKAALEQYARVRVETVIAQYNPRLPAEVKIFASRADTSPTVPKTETATPPDQPSLARKNEGFRLRAVVRTATSLSAQDAESLRTSIITALDLREANGDALIFEVGPLGFTSSTAAPVRERVVTGDLPRGESRILLPSNDGTLLLAAAMVALLAVAGTLLFVWRRKRPRLTPDEQQSFATLLADELAMQRANRHGG